MFATVLVETDAVQRIRARLVVIAIDEDEVPHPVVPGDEIRAIVDDDVQTGVFLRQPEVAGRDAGHARVDLDHGHASLRTVAMQELDHRRRAEADYQHLRRPGVVRCQSSGSIISRVYSSSSAYGRATRIAPCTHSVPKCR
jgi:hypothetical protein